MKTLQILLGAVGLFLAQLAHGAGVTIITHGYQFTSDWVDHGHGWVNAMSDYIADRAGGNAAVYEMVIGMNLATGKPAVGSFTLVSGSAPTSSANSEVIIRVFWDYVGGQYGNGTYEANTPDVAQAIEPFIAQLQAGSGLSHPLSELPIQLIGHSRGASVMSELARILGQKGIWVHQLTTLDPHPVLPSDFPFPGNDAPVQVFENVLFADNYYENISGTFPQGQSINGAYNRHLTSLDGGYPDTVPVVIPDGNHSDVHLWYHGTVNTGAGASDGVQTFTGTMRNTWYFSDEYGGQEAGFYYSRLGGGAWALDGFLFGYNDGYHNLLPDTRTSVTRSFSEWPTLTTLINNASGSIQAGNAFPVEFVYQSYDSGATVTAYLDTDQNPYNGNEIALTLPAINPQPSTGSATRLTDVNATVPSSTPAGYYYVYGKITNPNGTRYLYGRTQVRVLAAGTSAAPTITSVSPSTLPPSSLTQLINIYGSNFKATGDPNASTLIFRDPANIAYVRTPVFVSSSQLQYNITVQSAVGTWSVTVTNAAQSASNLKTFLVQTPPPNTGTLTINLSPAGAVSAGAQWRVDGGSYRNTGDTATALTPGSHTVSFKSVSGYTTPTDKSVSITSGVTATDSGTYTVIAPSNYTLTLNLGSTGYIINQPVGTYSGNGVYVYPSGSVVQLTAYANPGYHFAGWSGNLSGMANPITVTMDGNKNAFANFDSGDPSQGTIIVTIQPPEAVTAGVTWGFNENDFRASGTSFTRSPGGTAVIIHSTNGWVGAGGLVTITAGQTTNYTFTCDNTTGSTVGTDPRTYFTLAGSAGNSGFADATGVTAQFSAPWSVAVDTSSNVYVGDSGNSVIRKISPSGLVSTFAGKAGNTGSADGSGTNALFSRPYGVAIDVSNNLYIADFDSSTIRKITPAGAVTTLAGSAGSSGSTDATGSAARFNGPTGVAVDTNGNVYVADTYNCTIRKITPAGAVTTLAGSPLAFGSVDATGSAARFRYPPGLAVDTSGNVYVADQLNQTIRKITSDGVVTTLAGFSGSAGAADGTGSAARFSYPSGVAVDGTGNLFVADNNNSIIRKMTPAGVVTTLAGLSGHASTNDGIGNIVRFKYPNGITIDNAGKLFVADTGNQTIRATQSSATKFDQTITFGTLPDKYINDQPFALIATASSALTVTFSVVSGPATLSNNVVSLTGAGTVVVRASQVGDATFNAATNVDRSFVVAKLPQNITFGTLSKQAFGDAPFALSASASSGLPVNFSVLSGPAILSGNIATITGAGLVVLRASQSGDATNAPAPNVDQVLIVVPGNNVITDAQRLANGMFTLRFYGETGSNYVVKASTNLVDWLPVATNQISGLGYLEFTDTSSTNYDRRFYWITP
jgi:sugar lactone lactonase YvrE